MHSDAIKLTCPNCNAQPGQACTQPTDTGRRAVPWVHHSRDKAAQEVVLVPPSDAPGCHYCEWPATYIVFRGKSGRGEAVTCPTHLPLAVDQYQRNGFALVNQLEHTPKPVV